MFFFFCLVQARTQIFTRDKFTMEIFQMLFNSFDALIISYPQLLKVWNDHTLRYARTKGLRSTTEPFQTFPAKIFHMILDLLDPPILDFGFVG